VIPRDYITEWRSRAPWADNAQVEQDLVICRALVNIFSQQVLRDALAFRGGTALYKLYLTPAARYSEDIDLVQVRAEPAGAVMDALRAVLDPWLGEAKWKQTEGRVTFNYRFASEDPTPVSLRLKVEVNTREHFTEHGFRHVPFEVASRWFSGAWASLPTISTSYSAPSFARFTNVARAATCLISRLRFHGEKSIRRASLRRSGVIWMRAGITSRVHSSRKISR
jgi:hypothetical protein